MSDCLIIASSIEPSTKLFSNSYSSIISWNEPLFAHCVALFIKIPRVPPSVTAINNVIFIFFTYMCITLWKKYLSQTKILRKICTLTRNNQLLGISCVKMVICERENKYEFL